jgi:hypothetical protein
MHKCADADGNVSHRQTARLGIDIMRSIDSAPALRTGQSPGTAVCSGVCDLADRTADALKAGIPAPDLIAHRRATAQRQLRVQGRRCPCLSEGNRHDLCQRPARRLLQDRGHRPAGTGLHNVCGA